MTDELNNSEKSTESNLVDYFERGCLCLVTDRIEKHNKETVSEGLDYYMENCTCSRHPESAKRLCWDKQLGSIDKARLKQLIAEKESRYGIEIEAEVKQAIL